MPIYPVTSYVFFCWRCRFWFLHIVTALCRTAGYVWSSSGEDPQEEGEWDGGADQLQRHQRLPPPTLARLHHLRGLLCHCLSFHWTRHVRVCIIWIFLSKQSPYIPGVSTHEGLSLTCNFHTHTHTPSPPHTHTHTLTHTHTHIILHVYHHHSPLI